MSITTKTGDSGETSLIGGTRVLKYHPQVEAYGTIDELNSFIGLLRSFDLNSEIKNTLLTIQKQLFTIQSSLALEPDISKRKYDCSKINLLKTEDLNFIENEIKLIEKGIPPLKSFIIPGGNNVISYCHIARTICRRAERIVVLLSQNTNVEVNVHKYLNRLSDYLFVLARKISIDLNIDESFV